VHLIYPEHAEKQVGMDVREGISTGQGGFLAGVWYQ
jgi:hypothetical protein